MKLFTSIRVLVAGVVIGFSAVTSAHAAAADYFLKIEGIPGESTDERHKGWIEVLSFSHDIMNTRGGSVRPGTASFSDIQVAKQLDKATPKLMEACVSGKHIPSAELKIVSSNRENPQTYMTYKLKDVLISSYSAAGSGEAPVESLSLNFTKIEWTHTSQSATGEIVETHGSWDSKPTRK